MHIPFRLSVLAGAVILAGCGGGGGGGGGNTNTNPSSPPGSVNPMRSNVPFHTPVAVDTYAPMQGTGVDIPVADIFTKDLNNDNIDEVVVGGRKTQPSTAANWRNFNMQLYGWNTGTFTNETSTWFSGTDNVIVGSEPAIRFGDFDGDGNIDMFSAPGTDMDELYGNPVVFTNTGTNGFTRSEISLNGEEAWSHDSWVGDINGDGRDDIVMANIGGDHNLSVNYGNADGSFATYTGATPGGSGVSVADYLNDGTMTVILTDTATGVQSDTKLFSIDTSGANLVLTEVATLPASYFYNSQFDADRATAGLDPHEIRNFSMDFNNDGVTDVVVVSNLSSNDVNMSAMQFLRNDGGGTFTDVTDTVLVDYDHDIQASYQPIIMDINNDGLNDILLSASDWVAESGQHNSTRVLIQTSDGKFVQKYETAFKDFYNQIADTTDNALDNQLPINIIAGPDGEKYLFTSVLYEESGNIRAKSYLAKIGSTGTITPQTAADIVQANWPYLSDASVNAVLSETSPLSLNGVEVVDLASALQPVGGLGIVTSDRVSRVQISGSISLPGMNTQALNGLQAMDALGRNYTVDMASMAYNADPVFNLESIHTASQPWASGYITKDYSAQGVWAVGDNNQYSVAHNNTILNTDWNYSFSHTVMQSSPWMNFDGVFGEINSTNTMEANFSKQYNNGVWHQIGMLNTNTNFDSGLVTDVSNIQAVYGVMGYRDSNWNVRTGVQPVIVSGSVNMRLPTDVDTAGNLQYTDHTVNVRNQAEYFVNATRTFNAKYFDVHVNGNASTNGRNSTTITVETDF